MSSTRYLKHGSWGILGIALLLLSGQTQADNHTIPLSDTNCPVNLGSCTADDVQTFLGTNLTVLDDGCSSPSDTVTFEFDIIYDGKGGNTRYDLGAYFSLDGDPTQGNDACIGTVYRPGDGNATSVDVFTDVDGAPAGTLDSCGDIANGAAVTVSHEITVACEPDELNQLLVESCRVWNQNPGGVCSNLTDSGTGSKCDCTPLVFPEIIVPFPAYITIKKTVVGENASFDLKIDDVIEATGGNGTSTEQIEVGAGTSADPGASYVISESGAMADLADYDTELTCTEAAGTTVGPLAMTSLTLDVQRDEDWVCTFVNTRKTGDLTVTKMIDPASDAPPAGQQYTIDIDCNGMTKSGTVDVGGTVTLNDIPTGTQCTVNETDPIGSAWMTTYSPSAVVAIDEGSNSVTVVNKYIQPVADVIVKKTVTGDDPIPAQNFTIKLSCDDGTDQILTIAGGKMETVSNVAVGAVCSASEPVRPDNWALTSISYTPTNATVTDAGLMITVTNNYTRPVGAVTVEKVIIGATSIAPAQNFAIDLTCGTITYPLTIASGGSDTVSGIDAGLTCTATETAPAGWILDSISAPVVIAEGNTRTITVTNLYPFPMVDVDPYPTRTIGYWKTHPQAVEAALHAAGGSIDVCGNTVDNFCSAYDLLNLRGGGANNFLRQATAATLNCNAQTGGAAWGCPVGNTEFAN